MKEEQTVLLPHEKKGELLMEYQEIYGTPFQAVREGETWYIVWGSNLIWTNGLNSYEDCVKAAQPGSERFWNIVGVYSIIAVSNYYKDMEAKKEVNKEHTPLHERVTKE